MPNYTIRPMQREEVDLAIEWAAAEGGNPGLHGKAPVLPRDRWFGVMTFELG